MRDGYAWKPLMLALVAAYGWSLALPCALAQNGQRPAFGAVRTADDKPSVPAMVPARLPGSGPRQKRLDDSDRGGVLIYAMPVTAPSPDLLFRLDSEEVFRERLRMEARSLSPRLQLDFPDAGPLTPGTKAARNWPAQDVQIEPHYVVSKYLFFEQHRFERYGKDLGVLQPAVSTGVFVYDMLLWPAWRVTHPFRCYQVNTDCYSPYFQIVGE